MYPGLGCGACAGGCSQAKASRCGGGSDAPAETPAPASPTFWHGLWWLVAGVVLAKAVK